MSERLWLGTSGFAYSSWKGGFYPATLPQSKMLPSYAERFGAVEINYTFNRFPTEKLLEGWSAKVPQEFRFSLKGPRRITHELRLRDCAEAIERFLAPARVLGDRLGPALFQLPPTAKADAFLLEEFCSILPDLTRAAFEFRHPSWDTDLIRAILSKAGAAWVIADTDAADATPHVTAPAFTYLRLRKTAYTAEQLERWLTTIVSLLENGTEVYCYVRHDDDGLGVLAASVLREALEGLGEQRLQPAQDLTGGREQDAVHSDGIGGLHVGGDVVDE